MEAEKGDDEVWKALAAASPLIWIKRRRTGTKSELHSLENSEEEGVGAVGACLLCEKDDEQNWLEDRWMVRCSGKGCTSWFHPECAYERQQEDSCFSVQGRREPGSEPRLTLPLLKFYCSEHHQPPRYCTCRKSDDGSEAFVECEQCCEWYHFSCEKIGSDATHFVCSGCRQRETPVTEQERQANRSKMALYDSETMAATVVDFSLFLGSSSDLLGGRRPAAEDKEVEDLLSSGEDLIKRCEGEGESGDDGGDAVIPEILLSRAKQNLADMSTARGGAVAWSAEAEAWLANHVTEYWEVDVESRGSTSGAWRVSVADLEAEAEELALLEGRGKSLVVKPKADLAGISGALLLARWALRAQKAFQESGVISGDALAELALEGKKIGASASKRAAAAARYISILANVASTWSRKAHHLIQGAKEVSRAGPHTRLETLASHLHSLDAAISLPEEERELRSALEEWKGWSARAWGLVSRYFPGGELSLSQLAAGGEHLESFVADAQNILNVALQSQYPSVRVPARDDVQGILDRFDCAKRATALIQRAQAGTERIPQAEVSAVLESLMMYQPRGSRGVQEDDPLTRHLKDLAEGGSAVQRAVALLEGDGILSIAVVEASLQDLRSLPVRYDIEDRLGDAKIALEWDQSVLALLLAPSVDLAELVQLQKSVVEIISSKLPDSVELPGAAGLEKKLAEVAAWQENARRICGEASAERAAESGETSSLAARLHSALDTCRQLGVYCIPEEQQLWACVEGSAEKEWGGAFGTAVQDILCPPLQCTDEWEGPNSEVSLRLGVVGDLVHRGERLLLHPLSLQALAWFRDCYTALHKTAPEEACADAWSQLAARGRALVYILRRTPSPRAIVGCASCCRAMEEQLEPLEGAAWALRTNLALNVEGGPEALPRYSIQDARKLLSDFTSMSEVGRGGGLQSRAHAALERAVARTQRLDADCAELAVPRSVNKVAPEELFSVAAEVDGNLRDIRKLTRERAAPFRTDTERMLVQQSEALQWCAHAVRACAREETLSLRDLMRLSEIPPALLGQDSLGLIRSSQPDQLTNLVKEAHELGKGAAAWLQGSQQALSSRLQPGQDVPALLLRAPSRSIASFTTQAQLRSLLASPVLESVEPADGDWKELELVASRAAAWEGRALVTLKTTHISSTEKALAIRKLLIEAAEDGLPTLLPSISIACWVLLVLRSAEKIREAKAAASEARLTLQEANELIDIAAPLARIEKCAATEAACPTDMHPLAFRAGLAVNHLDSPGWLDPKEMCAVDLQEIQALRRTYANPSRISSQLTNRYSKLLAAPSTSIRADSPLLKTITAGHLSSMLSSIRTASMIILGGKELLRLYQWLACLDPAAEELKYAPPGLVSGRLSVAALTPLSGPNQGSSKMAGVSSSTTNAGSHSGGNSTKRKTASVSKAGVAGAGHPKSSGKKAKGLPPTAHSTLPVEPAPGRKDVSSSLHVAPGSSCMAPGCTKPPQAGRACCSRVCDIEASQAALDALALMKARGAIVWRSRGPSSLSDALEPHVISHVLSGAAKYLGFDPQKLSEDTARKVPQDEGLNSIAGLDDMEIDLLGTEDSHVLDKGEIFTADSLTEGWDVGGEQATQVALKRLMDAGDKVSKSRNAIVEKFAALFTAGMPVLGLLPNPTICRTLAWGLEREMHALFPIKNKAREYRDKRQSLLFNLSAEKNPELFKSIVMGNKSLRDLCLMTPKELAPSKQREELQRLKDESLGQHWRRESEGGDELVWDQAGGGFMTQSQMKKDASSVVESSAGAAFASDVPEKLAPKRKKGDKRKVRPSTNDMKAKMEGDSSEWPASLVIGEVAAPSLTTLPSTFSPMADTAPTEALPQLSLPSFEDDLPASFPQSKQGELELAGDGMSLVSPQRLREPSSPFITMPPVLPCDMNPSDGCFDVSNPASEKRFFVRADADASYTFLRGILPYMWEIRGRLTPSGGIQYRDSLLVPGTSRAVMRITPGPQMRSAEYFGELVRQYETYPSGPSSEVGRVGWVQWKDNAICTDIILIPPTFCEIFGIEMGSNDGEDYMAAFVASRPRGMAVPQPHAHPPNSGPALALPPWDEGSMLTVAVYVASAPNTEERLREMRADPKSRESYPFIMEGHPGWPHLQRRLHDMRSAGGTAR